MTSRPRGSNTPCFRYKRLKRTQPPAPAPPEYVKKLAWATITVNGTEKKVEYQDKYTCAPCTFPQAFVNPNPSRTYVDRILKRPSNKRLRCIMCSQLGTPDACSNSGTDCTMVKFFQRRDVRASLELCETPSLGIGVFTTAVLPKNTEIGIYTGVLRQADDLTDLQRSYAAAPDNWSLSDEQDNKLTVHYDALEKGSWTRFVNHHCVPNCSLKSAKACGKLRVHYLRTGNKDIPAGTQLFVDYGQSYFRKGRRITKQGCLCGHSKCHSKKRTRR